MNYHSVMFNLREYFFPCGCGGCGTILKSPIDTFYGLCEKCRTFFETTLAEEKRCVFCGKPLISETNTCLLCRKRGIAETGSYSEVLVKVRTLFPYKSKFKTILGNYKFKKYLGIGNYLVFCLQTALDTFYPELASNEEIAWVPVPPRPGKIKKQGWDQIDYLSGLLSKDYRRIHGKITENNSNNAISNSIQVSRCLKRLASRSQKELNREQRVTNLKGRILCIKKPPKNAILFDDVFTTGTTLNACASALLKSGAAKVYGLCLFYD